ncbi:MAG: transposase [Candidatus Aminicenantales bacterium]
MTGEDLVPGVVAAIQTFGDRINFHPHLHFLVTEGGVDEAGLFHLIPRMDDARLAALFTREVLAFLVGKGLLSPGWAVRKASLAALPLRIVEDELRRIPSKAWAAMIRKVYEVDPMLCPKCGGLMKIIAFLTEYAVVDRIIDHLKLTFVAAKQGSSPDIGVGPRHI